MMKQIDTGFLNGLRFLFALWVALGHFFDYSGGSTNAYVDNLLLNPDPAVNGFMMITGFLMTYHYLLRSGREDPARPTTFVYFWVRRAFRLYPVYLLCILAAYLYYDRNSELISSNYAYFTGNSYENSGMRDSVPGIGSLLGHLTLLHGFVPGMNVNLLTPAWSLATEAQFYWLFPLLFLFLFGKEKNMSLRISIAIVAAVVLERASLKLLGVWDGGLLMTFHAPSLLTYKLNFFILGIVMAAVALKTIGKAHLWIATVLIVSFQDFVTSLIVVALIALLFSPEGKPYLHPLFHRGLTLAKAALSARPAAIGAELSYSLYLSHMLVFPTVIWYTRQLGLGEAETMMVACAGFMGINLMLSYALFTLVEKPLISVGKGVIHSWAKSRSGSGRSEARSA